MRGGEYIEHLLAGVKRGITFNTVNHGCKAMENLNARLLEFSAHRDGKGAADDAGDDCKNQVQSTDIFMIGRVYPTNPAVRLVVVVGTMLVSCCASHGICSRFSTVLAFGILKTRRSHFLVCTAFAGRLQRLVRSAQIRFRSSKPGLILILGDNAYGNRHIAVILAAKLRTLTVIKAFTVRFEPRLVA